MSEPRARRQKWDDLSLKMPMYIVLFVLGPMALLVAIIAVVSLILLW